MFDAAGLGTHVEMHFYPWWKPATWENEERGKDYSHKEEYALDPRLGYF